MSPLWPDYKTVVSQKAVSPASSSLWPEASKIITKVAPPAPPIGTMGNTYLSQSPVKNWDDMNLWEKTKAMAIETPNTVKQLAEGFTSLFTKPSETEQNVEKMLIPPSIINTPFSIPHKAFIRFTEPMVEPLGKDIGEIQAVNELSKKVAKGEMPAKVLDEIEVLKKTAPQIVGDVSQAVLSIFTPQVGLKIAEQGAKLSATEAVKLGIARGTAVGLPFGAAQALSSGSKDPQKIIQIIGATAGLGGLLGGVLGGAIPVSREIFNKVNKIMKAEPPPAEPPPAEPAPKEPPPVEKPIIPHAEEIIKSAERAKSVSESPAIPKGTWVTDTSAPGFGIRGEVIGEGILGKDLPAYKIKMPDGKISIIPKESAKIMGAIEGETMAETLARIKQIPKGEKITFAEKASEIKRISNNLLKHNPDITRTDAEAMARDLLWNKANAEAKPIVIQTPTDKVGERQAVKSSASQEVWPEIKTSGIAKSIEAKAVEAKLTKGFENLAGYEKINIKDQAQRAADLINTDIENARKVIRGEQPLPEGLKGTSLITAMEEHIKKSKDMNMAYELANSPLVSETSVAAQEMRLAAERVPDSAAAKIIEIKKAREAQINDLPKKKNATSKTLKNETSKVNLPKEQLSWDKFLSEITC